MSIAPPEQSSRDATEDGAQLPVTIAQDPMSCVALGIGRMLDEAGLLEKVALPA